jgi:peptide/nickel transport system ATP-binding protein
VTKTFIRAKYAGEAKYRKDGKVAPSRGPATPRSARRPPSPHLAPGSPFAPGSGWRKRPALAALMPLLEIKNLQLEFGSKEKPLRAVDGVSLSIEAGETLCLVGESGCGKSVTALSVARLVPSPPARYVGGEILLEGRDVLRMNASELRQIRGGVVSYIFQEPSASLNPVFRVGSQIKESLKLHRPAKATDEEVIRLLKLVGIPAPESRRRDYPHQLSGGMQQRVMIAMALASEPRLLVADEPTTALDVTIQAQILELLLDLKKRLGMAMLLITHNLGIVSDIADRLAVMYAGQLVELASAADLLRRPVHPYTRALMNSVPKLGNGKERLQAIGGNVPNPGAWPKGCRFFPRCPNAAQHPDCKETAPSLVEIEPGRWVRCLYAKELA